MYILLVPGGCTIVGLFFLLIISCYKCYPRYVDMYRRRKNNWFMSSGENLHLLGSRSSIVYIAGPA